MLNNRAKQVAKENTKLRTQKKDDAVGILVTCVGNRIRVKIQYTNIHKKEEV